MYTSPPDLSLKLSRDQYPNYSMYHFWKSADNLQEIISDERKNPSSGCWLFFFQSSSEIEAELASFALKSPKAFRSSDAETPPKRLFAGISGAWNRLDLPGGYYHHFRGVCFCSQSLLSSQISCALFGERDSDRLLFWIFLLIRQIVR
ncbi:hypothetical protein CDAR_603651 [Caerostris darwini]|uniref:Uncharacterized protein n=1 Tax=Caerostris darwini TaxID=1538125 RepID=A0AAV4T4D7_9ARAC|nr:hypothetical protein CDAR_603651 [Caerostris darwini]